MHAMLNSQTHRNAMVAMTAHMGRMLRAFPDVAGAFCFTTASVVRRTGVVRKPSLSFALRIDPIIWLPGGPAAPPRMARADVSIPATPMQVAAPAASCTLQDALDAHFEAQHDILTGRVPHNLLVDLMRPPSGPASPGRCVDVGSGRVVIPFAASPAATIGGARATTTGEPSSRRVTFRIARAVCGNGVHWWTFLRCAGAWWEVNDANTTRVDAEFPRAALSKFGTLFWLRRVD